MFTGRHCPVLCGHALFDDHFAGVHQPGIDTAPFQVCNQQRCNKVIPVGE